MMLFIGFSLVCVGAWMICARLAVNKWPWDDWRQTWQRWLKR